jgi:hypothetical protein
MTLRYVPPSLMESYRSRIQLFAKGAPALECVRSHFFPEKTGICDLTGAKEQEEIFVLQNRSGSTLKVSEFGMQLVANIVDIESADAWYEHLKEQRKIHKDRLVIEAAKRDEERKAAAKTVLVRRKNPSISLK